MNTVKYLRDHPFSQLNGQEKLEVKRLGPDRPELIRSQSSRKFSSGWYNKYEWLTGCSESQRVYCFPFLLFGQSQREKSWTQQGVSDWKHFSEKTKRHVQCKRHIENCLKLASFGCSNIAEQLSETYHASKLHHNCEVEENRHVLS